MTLSDRERADVLFSEFPIARIPIVDDRAVRGTHPSCQSPFLSLGELLRMYGSAKKSTVVSCLSRRPSFPYRMSVNPIRRAVRTGAPVRFVLNNSANVTQTFEVFVVEAGATVKTELDDGRTGNWTIGQGLSTVSTSGEYYVTVEPPESARLHGRYTLEPDEMIRSSINEFTKNTAVIIVLYQNGKIGWWASVYCSDGALVDFKAVSRPSKAGGDGWASYGCHNTLF